MKIGILTHYYRSLNYGGMLQAYALVKYLEKKGYPAEQLCYDFSPKPFLPPRPQEDKTASPPSGNLFRKGCRRIYRSLHYRLIDKKRERYYAEYKKNVIPRRAERFSAFQDRVPHSEAACDPSSVASAADRYDCLITGSDQVWNFTWFNPAFFLDFPDSSARKIAYAASAGKASFGPEETQYLKKTIPMFHAVSVRESDLADTLNELLETDDVVQTVDPTLLLSPADWDEIAVPRLIREKYLFCYFLHNDALLSKLAKQFARKRHLKIVTIPFPGIEYNAADVRFGDYRLDDADPSDFISLVKHANYVLTDSFHATVFSLIYGKQFVAFPRGDAKGMSSRLHTLTKMFGCEERFCRVSKEKWAEYIASLPAYAAKQNPDFENVKQASEAFLLRALAE